MYRQALEKALSDIRSGPQQAEEPTAFGPHTGANLAEAEEPTAFLVRVLVRLPIKTTLPLTLLMSRDD